MAANRVITMIIVTLCTLMIGLVSCYPTKQDQVTTNEKQAFYKDVLQLLSSKVHLPGSKGTTKSWPPHNTDKDMFNGWHLGNGKSFLKSQANGQTDFEADRLDDEIGKRDYGDLGFIFGKREADIPAAIERQSRNYNDMGFFFGKRNAVDEANEFEDFGA